MARRIRAAPAMEPIEAPTFTPVEVPLLDEPVLRAFWWKVV